MKRTRAKPLAISIALAAILSGAVTSIYADEPEENESVRGAKRILPSEQVDEPPVATAPSQTLPSDDAAVLPLLTGDDAGANLVSADKLFVKTVQIDGATAFSPDVLKAMTKEFEGKTLSFEDLHRLGYAVSKMYLDRGYVNSGVVIPDQKVADGVVKLTVVEGKLGKVNINGNEGLRDAYISNRLVANLSNPLNLKDLQASLKLLERDPLIEQVNAELTPGLSYGDSVLNLNVRERNRFLANVAVDNYRSPSIGAERVSVSLGHRNLSGWGDRLQVGAGLTKGLNDYNVFYSVPVNSRNTTLTTYAARTESVVIEEPFDEIDIASRSVDYGFTLEQPLVRSLQRDVGVSLGFEVKQNETTLLGQPFTFSEGAKDGTSRVNVLVASVSYSSYLPKTVVAARLTGRQGLRVLGATENKTGPDGGFTTFLGQIQVASRLFSTASEIVFRTNLQVAAGPLLAIERFGVGGANSVRGYRENTLLRDNGAFSSLELRVPVFIAKRGATRFNVVPFVDGGAAWNDSGSSQSSASEKLYSVGLAVEMNAWKYLNVKLAYGYALTEVKANTTGDLQDEGVHFGLAYTFQ